MVLLWVSCPGLGLAAAQEQLQPEKWDAGLKLTEAEDLNSDPRVVEVDLEARVARVEITSGLLVEAWTYNGGLPGPLIRVRVGDRLIVHFSNRLPKPTTVHWHGIRLPNRMDGVPGHSQPEVQPGESFTYDFVVPDAGLFWYHPHVMSAAQVGFGLYGALLVENPAESVGTADELVLVLSDIEIRDDGSLESPDTGASTGMAFGREGNHLLVNGREGGRLLARSGAPQRWRIVNAAKSRYFQLDLGDRLFTDNQPYTMIGVDGGLLEYPVKRDTLVVAPGERADVIVSPRAAPGTELVVRSLLYDRGYGSVEARVPFDELFTVTMADLPPYAGGPLPETRRSIEPLSTAGATQIDVQFTLAQLRDGSFEYPHQRRVIRERQTGAGDARRNASLDGDEQDQVVAPISPARLLLPGTGWSRRPCASAGLEGYRQRAVRADHTVRCALRRSPRKLDVPLPRARSRRWGLDGHRAGGCTGHESFGSWSAVRGIQPLVQRHALPAGRLAALDASP